VRIKRNKRDWLLPGLFPNSPDFIPNKKTKYYLFKFRSGLASERFYFFLLPQPVINRFFKKVGIYSGNIPDFKTAFIIKIKSGLFIF